MANGLQSRLRVTEPALADEPVSTRCDDRSAIAHPGSTLLGVIPCSAHEGARARTRGSRPLSSGGSEEERPASVRRELTDHVEVWTHLDALRPQAERRIANGVARIARWLAVAAAAVLALVAIGYVVTAAFFSFSETWLVPAAVPASDARVVAIERELAAHQQARDRIAAELAAAGPARATARRDALAASLAERDRQIAEARSSPYLRAAAGGAVLAAAPYGNLDRVGAGTAVYACRLRMVWCRRVGAVVGVLRGDVTFQHPHRDRPLVGRMLELRLDDPAAAQAEILFVGGPPLWL